MLTGRSSGGVPPALGDRGGAEGERDGGSEGGGQRGSGTWLAWLHSASLMKTRASCTAAECEVPDGARPFYRAGGSPPAVPLQPSSCPSAALHLPRLCCVCWSSLLSPTGHCQVSSINSGMNGVCWICGSSLPSAPQIDPLVQWSTMAQLDWHLGC